jgi:tRNA(Arg) A34 adenosine deaminase TadA
MTGNDQHLLAAIELAKRARDNGDHPFGALLVDADGNVVVEGENTVVTRRDCTGHAEANVMRIASERFDREFLRGCTLYTSTEPCPMCAGAIYWGNVRRVVFALSAKDLHAIVGNDPENGILEIPCREIFAQGDHGVEVSGPTFRNRRGRCTTVSGPEPARREGSVDGVGWLDGVEPPLVWDALERDDAPLTKLDSRSGNEAPAARARDAVAGAPSSGGRRARPASPSSRRCR